MSYASEAPAGRPVGRTVIAAVLVIIAILCIIAGVLYLTEPAHSLPSVLGAIHRPAKGWKAHRPLRGSVALAIGVILLITGGAAWFYKSKDRY